MGTARSGLKTDMENGLFWSEIESGIPHSINYEETGTSEGLWDRLGRRKMTNMSFSTFFGEAKLKRAKLGALKTFENDMFVIFRLPK